jgi:2-hydroxymuconate-semialdehyde hydrolase
MAEIIVHSRVERIGGVRTHYLEAGSGPPLILLHSGEFGGCAELSWERNIQALSAQFRVLAPDWVGFGKTEKLFSFEDMWAFRVHHITQFLHHLGIARAHFIGNSMGGTMLLAVAAAEKPVWPLERIIAIAGGGSVPENAARNVLNSYDGSYDHMERIVETMFLDPTIQKDKAYIERRNDLAREPGAWECTAAVRFKAPWVQRSAVPSKPDYSLISVPTLLVTGEKDPLRDPGFGASLQQEIPGSQLHVIANAGHCPHIEYPAEFAEVALEFLRRA